ncbi:MAG: hypothetical protein EWM47_05585, partial [Anaerolineaceae bacterium]
MNKVWEFVIDIFAGILIIFVSVTIYFGLRTETVMKSMYEGITDEFIIDVKKNGVIDIGDYEKYMTKMGMGNSLFNISFEHRYKIFEPEYRFKTLEEIIEDQNREYGGSNDYHYREVVTEKPHVDDPINDGNLNTETNESILEKAVNGQVDPDHLHDENCYGGHKHIGEPLFTHTHQHSSSCREFVELWDQEILCRNCGSIYIRFLASYYWDESTNSVKLGMSNGGIAECFSCGSRNVTVLRELKGYNYSCNYFMDINGDGYTDPVGRENTYSYIKNKPQDTSVQSTKVSGCYKYHNHAVFPYSGYNPSGNRTYTTSNL